MKRLPKSRCHGVNDVALTFGQCSIKSVLQLASFLESQIVAPVAQNELLTHAMAMRLAQYLLPNTTATTSSTTIEFIFSMKFENH